MKRDIANARSRQKRLVRLHARPRQGNAEVKSVNILYGNNIKLLTQLIASYHWSKPKLGPAVAKKVADLFEGSVYETIRETKPELADHLHIIDNNLNECQRSLTNDKVYVRTLKSYARFAVLAIAANALQAAGAKIGE